MSTIYDRIEWLIKTQGLSKKDFCLKLAISTGNLGDWKRGKSTPSTHKLIEIAAFFDVSLDWLLTGKERLAGQVNERREAYIAETATWKELYGELTSEEAAFIKEYLAFARSRRQKDEQGN